MKKNITKIIIGIFVIILVAVILVIINNSYAPKKEETKDDVIYKEPTIKQLKLKSISTKDKSIRIDDTIAYFTPDNGISQVDLQINSKNSLSDLYLLVEFELDNKIENIIVYKENITANEVFKYMLQSEEDLTKTKKWKVSQVTMDEAILKGYIKLEE